ncbi:MAG: hypothetical protein H7645_02745 [Candidatus Heimdallarchaeota archaeon]|nr:hypothetical protein [Candidatus Heimdallarchaeota archaeon]MCK4769233.1 hypothetical protein [Candidatus Heimdallarchaeota archaeon]
MDLSIETDPSDTVVITPCCSVYVHIEHILEWLEIKEICPNYKIGDNRRGLLSKIIISNSIFQIYLLKIPHDQILLSSNFFN